MNQNIEAAELVYHAGRGASHGVIDTDPIRTEVIRHSLKSAAEQMKRAVIRTAFSPIVYEALDFAVAIYDRQVRLLAQAPTFPLFMGTLSFCVEAAVEEVGGEDALDPGDIILYNLPYESGSHQQDAAVVMPVFLSDGALIGYTAIKAHWMDIAAKDPYSTDTIDVFQEGTIYPGIKLYRRGELVEDVYRLVLANSRVPKAVAGDITSQIVGVRIGAANLLRIIDRWGTDAVWEATERMYDHGEAVMRTFLETIPDGRYVGHGKLDDDGVGTEPVCFDIVIEVNGSDVRVDYSNAPDATAGAMNCPLPSTVSLSRVAFAMLAGIDAPNEGHFRPIEIVARPGSMFYPLPPSPCFLCGWPSLHGIEVVFQALAAGITDGVPACSGGDFCSIIVWGTREETGEPWADGGPHPIGQGAHSHGDGADSLVHIGCSGCRMAALEIWEARNPWLIEKAELAQDSGGAGLYRGGLGIDVVFRILEDEWLTMCFERTKSIPWGLEGGEAGRRNHAILAYPDGSEREVAKVTRLALPRGATLSLHCGGGGGWGDPSLRDSVAVRRDLRAGYISVEHAERYYGHAIETS